LAQYWLFVLGGIFVAVTLLLPRGIVGTISYGWNAWRARRESVKAEEGRDADLTSPEPVLLPSDSDTRSHSTDEGAVADMPSLGDADGKRA
jgi:hypothetical protein